MCMLSEKEKERYIELKERIYREETFHDIPPLTRSELIEYAELYSKLITTNENRN